MVDSAGAPDQPDSVPFAHVDVHRNWAATGWALFKEATSNSRVPLSDGTRSGLLAGIVGLSSFALAVALLIFAEIPLGRSEDFPPGAVSDPGLGAITLTVGLLLIGAFFAVCAWNNGAAAHEYPTSVLGRYIDRFVVVVIGAANTLIGLSLLAAAAQIRTGSGIFAELPSLIPPLSNGDRLMLTLGVVACVATVAFLAVDAFGRGGMRTAGAALAAVPSAMCALAYLLSSKDATALQPWADRYVRDAMGALDASLRAADSSRIAGGPILVIVTLSATLVALLVTLGIAEFVAVKTSLTVIAFRWVEPTRIVVIGVVILSIAYFVVARIGLLPDSVETLALFSTEEADSWILAALLAGAGLLAIRTTYARPPRQRGVAGVVAIAAVSIVSGTVFLALCTLGVTLSNDLGGDGLHVAQFIADHIAPTALWLQDWATPAIALLLGLWGGWEWFTRERTDRALFAIAFAATALPLRLQVLLEAHDMRSFSAATPDQVAFAAIVLTGVSVVARRPVAGYPVLGRLVVIGFLVALFDGLLPDDWKVSTFEMLLALPFVYRFVFDARDLRDRPHRAHVIVAAIGLLLVANAIAVAVGQLTVGSYETSQRFAFFQLAIPLLLVALCTDDSAPIPRAATDDRSSAPGPVTAHSAPRFESLWRRAIPAVAAAVATATLVFAIVQMPGPYERGQFRVNAPHVPAELTAEQIEASSNAEAIQIQSDTFSVTANHTSVESGSPDPCSVPELERYQVDFTLQAPAGTMSGMRATEYPRPDGLSLYCASEDDDRSIRSILVLAFSGGLTEEPRGIADGIELVWVDTV